MHSSMRNNSHGTKQVRTIYKYVRIDLFSLTDDIMMTSLVRYFLPSQHSRDTLLSYGHFGNWVLCTMTSCKIDTKMESKTGAESAFLYFYHYHLQR